MTRRIERSAEAKTRPQTPIVSGRKNKSLPLSLWLFAFALAFVLAFALVLALTLAFARGA